MVTTLFYASNYNLASQLLRFIIYIYFFTIFNTKHTNKDGRGSHVKSCWKNRCYVSHCLDLIQWAAFHLYMYAWYWMWWKRKDEASVGIGRISAAVRHYLAKYKCKELQNNVWDEWRLSWATRVRAYLLGGRQTLNYALLV